MEYLYSDNYTHVPAFAWVCEAHVWQTVIPRLGLDPTLLPRDTSEKSHSEDGPNHIKSIIHLSFSNHVLSAGCVCFPNTLN